MNGIPKKWVFLFLVPLLIACRDKEVVVNSDLNLVSTENIEIAAGKKILFGHMSVGANVLEGINALKAMDPRFGSIQVKGFSRGSMVSAPGIYHYELGFNTQPGEKLNTCKKIVLEDGAGKYFDIFVFKYCYVDVRLDSDVDSMLENYSEMVGRIKEGFPDIQIVHVTVPLTSDFKGIKGWMKKVLGKQHPNELRADFNDKLIRRFGDEDMIYDLARVESTDNNGRRLFRESRGKKIFFLADEYTNDGGHLNGQGQVLAALEFIRILGQSK